jgi:Zn-dependent protease
MLRFSLFGFPILIHWFFWLNTALLSGRIGSSSPEQLQALAIWVAAVLVSIIIHELGHAFTMRRYGARPHIVLYALGGLAIPDRGFRRGQDIVVSLAGPLVQIAVGLGAMFLLRHSSGDAWWIQVFLSDFIFVSIWWGMFNLLPIFPLDGGHVMNSFLGPSFYKITMWTGAILAALVGFYLFDRTHSLFNLLFFGMLAWQNIQRANGAQPPPFLRPD